MVSREDAVRAKDGMEMRANGNMPQNDDESQLRVSLKDLCLPSNSTDTT